MSKELNYLIRSMIEADNTLEQNKIFENTFSRSDNIKIFLFDEKNSNIDETFKNKKINGYKTFGLADYTKAWVLDSKHIGEESRELKIGKVVHFDLNILTYLNNFLNNRMQNIDISNFIEYIEFIENNQFNYNISTAIMERSASAINNYGKKAWSEIIISYVKFSNKNFNITHPNKIMLTESDYEWAKDIYDFLLQEKEQISQYQALCCLMLKAFLIKQDKEIKNKTEVLLHYSLDVLNVYLELETIIIDKYFKNEKSVKKIFEKIENFSKDTVKKILNTTWDISHVRLMELTLAEDNKDVEEVFLPYFSSRDLAFNELSEINPIKMFIIYEEQSFAIRKKGISDICTNESLLSKIENETEKRKINVNKVDLEGEKIKLMNEVKYKQNLLFKK